MQSNRENLRCLYRYDPLDRLVDYEPSGQALTRRFYLIDRLVTETQGAAQRTIMQHEDQLLAQQQRQNGIAETQLLATDQQRSVLNVLDAPQPNCFAYTPYGHRAPENGLLSLLGFNGERPDPLTGHYLLGNGYRAFNPVLMRFNSPDSWSPFGDGGFNAYAYGFGDPINKIDSTGHSPLSFMRNIFSYFRHPKNTSFKKPSQPGAHKNIITLSGNMKDTRSINQGITSFVDTYDGYDRINFVGHGSDKPINGYHYIMSETHALTPNQLYDAAISAGIKISDYRNIRLVMCYSGNGGSASFAQRFSDITKIPVKGFINPVSLDPGVDQISYVLRSGLVQRLSNKPMKIYKENPYIKKTKAYRLFSYQPVKYYPR